MHRKHKVLIFISILMLVGISQMSMALAINGGNPKPNDSNIKVAVTSGILADFVGNIVDQDLDPIIDAGTCPAHYDVQPEDAALVSGADVIFYHGFEGAWFETLVDENNQDAELVLMGDLASGPWLPPLKAKEYLTAITQKLIQIYSEEEDVFNSNLNTYKTLIDEESTKIKEEFAESEYYGTNAVVMQFQAMFATWLGLNVSTTFGPDETLGAQDIVSIVTEANDKDCQLVVMNFPSGTDAGKEIASEIGAKYAIWGNFAGDLGSENYIDLIEMNMNSAKDPETPGQDLIGIDIFLPFMAIMVATVSILTIKHIKHQKTN